MIISLLKTFTTPILPPPLPHKKKKSTSLQWPQDTGPLVHSCSPHLSLTHILDVSSNTLGMLPHSGLECSLCLECSSLQYPQGSLPSIRPLLSNHLLSETPEQLYLKSQASTHTIPGPLSSSPHNLLFHSLKHLLTNSIICWSITFYAYCLSPTTII